jgi:hypothetical protein
MASPCLSHPRAPTAADEGRRAQAVGISSRLCHPERHLYENQFREFRPRSRVDRPSNAVFHRGNHAVLQRRFVTLAKRAEFDSWKIWLGPWLRSFLSIRVQCSRRGRVYRQTRGTSPKEGLCRRAQIICRKTWLGMEERLKPLKRFQVGSRAFTWLQPGVDSSGVGQPFQRLTAISNR